MASFARPTPPAPHDDDPSVQALFEEITAEVKAENFKKFLERYGNYIAALVLAIVIGTAGFSAWKSWTLHEEQKETAVLISLMNRDPSTFTNEELKSVVESFIQLGKDGHSEGIRFAAGIAEVSTLMKKGEKDAAIQRLDALSGDTSIRPLYRDYARLQSIRAQLDGGDPQVLQARLVTLEDQNNPWHLSALELAAMLDAKAGHPDLAIAKLQRILDAPEASLAAREEASQLLRLYKAM